MKAAIAFTTLLACACGLPLIYCGGLEIIAVGLLCVVFAFLYTTVLSYKGWGDALVIVFFGLVPVGFTFYVQLHTWTTEVTFAALACGLVIDTLLMVNNYRDREQDKISGKRTLVVRYGATAASHIYLGLGIAGVVLCLPFLWRGFEWAFLLPVCYLIWHTIAWQYMVTNKPRAQSTSSLLDTALHSIMFVLLLSLGLLL